MSGRRSVRVEKPDRRMDVHSPTSIRPEDYAYAGWFANRPPTDAEGIEVEMETALWEVPGFGPLTFGEALSSERSPDRAYPGDLDRCDHCGAHLNYACVYRHEPTDQFVVLGHRCADSVMGYSDRRALDAARRRNLVAAARKDAAQEAERREKLAEAKRLYPEAYEVLDGYDGPNRFISDVAGKLAETGHLTEAQAEKVVEAHGRDLKRRERREAGEEQPVPTGEAAKGAVVEGMVVKAEERDDPYAGRWGRPYRVAITVRDDRGFVVWGRAPEALHGLETPEGRRDVAKGDRVRFVANLKAKKNDSYFAFFERPRKAEVLALREPPRPDSEEVAQAEREAVRAVVRNVRERLREAGEVPDTYSARKAVHIIDDLVEGGHDGPATEWWRETGGKELGRFREEWDAVRRENALGAYRGIKRIVDEAGGEVAERFAVHLRDTARIYVELGGSPEDVAESVREGV